jgi:hypothetical protein
MHSDENRALKNLLEGSEMPYHTVPAMTSMPTTHCGGLGGPWAVTGLTSGFTYQSISESAYLEHRRAARECEQHGCGPRTTPQK